MYLVANLQTCDARITLLHSYLSLTIESCLILQCLQSILWWMVRRWCGNPCAICWIGWRSTCPLRWTSLGEMTDGWSGKLCRAAEMGPSAPGLILCGALLRSCLGLLQQGLLHEVSSCCGSLSLPHWRFRMVLRRRLIQPLDPQETCIQFSHVPPHPSTWGSPQSWLGAQL